MSPEAVFAVLPHITTFLAAGVMTVAEPQLPRGLSRCSRCMSEPHAHWFSGMLPLPSVLDDTSWSLQSHRQTAPAFALMTQEQQLTVQWYGMGIS